ncbi:hypothetical protein METBIDRAFT_30275 [Metschnikowia bicuspidata var. bicuspidata NRRL YB-4993]|uniref:EamA domain-containing protein n=1 Tax=Metschnikowia bicuspidata var. bicuspidata NRRL YB-4993 TaxID=869754 RepID=A0A1A0HJ44_9ASCO|nr:hypothetical protein METBIDRAFT_30275 [Metschnikowia bicuspidata var. bicuspidata NRRL YB-4993]OBA23907.1 hypothetical protein METBIDRAFT_30275 [Metschnikowia bicuspidata var. bicuspidata NRRL YB-4993]
MLQSHSDPNVSTLVSPRVKAQEIPCRVLSSVDEVIEVINDQEKKNFKLGVILLIVAICTWIVGLELVNAVLKGNEFQKPIFLAVLTGSCFILNFVPNLVSCIANMLRLAPTSFPNSSPLLSSSDLEIYNQVAWKAFTPSTYLDAPHCESKFLSFHEVLSLAFQISVIYCLYNTMVLLSLQYTSASNQTILGSTTTFFTLCLGIMMKIDRFLVKKLACVVSSLIGVILINLGGEDLSGSTENKFKSKSSVYGNFLALLGAFFYALYLIRMKTKCGTGQKTTNERELFGWVGVFSLLFGIPLLIFSDFFGVEKFEIPSTYSILVMISINAIFSVVSDYVTILAMLLTSPLVTSLALTSSIPITIFLDLLILDISQDTSPSSASRTLMYGFGVLCILVSVILININITSENELIEEVIEETLEAAIQDDEILSPILSPYLASSSAQAMFGNDVGIRSLMSPKLGWRGKRQISELTQLKEVSNFSLNVNPQDSSDESPLRNVNYSVRSYINSDLLIGGSSVHEESTNLVLSGGVNHKFGLEYAAQNTD